MKIVVHAHDNPIAVDVAALFSFLSEAGLATQGGEVCWLGETTPVLPDGFRESLDEQGADLHIAYLDKRRHRAERLLGHLPKPLLLIGWMGEPLEIDHVCVPFEGKRFDAPWMQAVFHLAQNMSWKVRLLHADHNVLAHEIVRLADWFRLDSVKDALEEWSTNELRTSFEKAITDAPETEVKAGIGRLKHVFEDEHLRRTMLLGALSSGYHLPGRHHGLHYGALLAETGVSGFFIKERDA